VSIVAVCHQGVNVYDDMPANDYHADPAPEPSLSSSIAKILVTQSPLHAWFAHPRLNPHHRPEESEDFDRGSAAHSLLLEGDDRMVECAFNDWRTNAAKDMRDKIRLEGKLPLLTKHIGSVRKMVEIAKAFLFDSELQVLIDRCFAERTVIWQASGIWKRARFDLQVRDRPLLIDYKTAESADPLSFSRQIIAMGYDVQAAHYTEAYDAIYTPPEAPQSSFVFLVQERSEPFACSLVGVDPMLLDLGQQKCEFASKLWKQCLDSGKWPGYPKQIAWASPPAWAFENFEQRRLGA
jgi:hypothetical protein